MEEGAKSGKEMWQGEDAMRSRYQYPMVMHDIDGTSRHHRRPFESDSGVLSLPGLGFRQAVQELLSVHNELLVCIANT